MTERDIEGLRHILNGLAREPEDPRDAVIVEAAVALVCGVAKDIARIAQALELIAQNMALK